jgi:NAD(P)H-flavin reductase
MASKKKQSQQGARSGKDQRKGKASDKAATSSKGTPAPDAKAAAADARKAETGTPSAADVRKTETPPPSTADARKAETDTPTAEAVASLDVKPASGEAKVPQIKPSGTPQIKENLQPAVKQTQTPAVKKTESPAVRETQSPAVKQVQTPAVKTSTPPAVQTETNPSGKTETPSSGQSDAAGPEAKTSAPQKGDSPNAPEAKESPAAPKTQAAPTSHPIPPLDGKAPTFTPRPKPQNDNPYLPQVATVAEVIPETHNIVTLRVTIDDPAAMASFVHEPGQVGQLSVFGAGESTFVINSPPSQKNHLQFSVMRAGEVTAAIHRLRPGDKVGVRAPLGNFFPYETWKGKDVLFVGGGIGMAPLRVIMLHMLERKKDYGRIGLLYGARSPADMAFSYELDGWMQNPDLDCTLCIDAPAEGWPHKVGLIPNVLLELAPKPDNRIAVLCGPPIMIKFTVQALEKLGFPPEAIVTTLEKRMKCGIGICGRCNIGGRYVCVDGPVFTWKQLQDLPPEL